ncbi:hypothetical protein ACA910_003019 [Epithemia clementina (nom. ined.)]
MVSAFAFASSCNDSSLYNPPPMNSKRAATATRTTTTPVRRGGGGGGSSNSGGKTVLHETRSISFSKERESKSATNGPASYLSLITTTGADSSPRKVLRQDVAGSSNSNKSHKTMDSSLLRFVVYLALPMLFFMGRGIRMMADLSSLDTSAASGSLFQQLQLSTTRSNNTSDEVKDERVIQLVQSTTAFSTAMFHPNKPAKETNSTTVTRNRRRIQTILQANSAIWGLYQSMQIRSGGPLQQQRMAIPNSGAITVDMTQNLPRIQDYADATMEAHHDSHERIDPKSSSRHRQNGEIDRDAVFDRIGTTKTATLKSNNDKPLNIVLFYADDWTMNVLGALNPNVYTPNIDNMGGNGMVFTRNCVTTSICWISRNSLATGVYAAIHQTLEVQSTAMFNKTVPWLQTLYPLLKQHGYYTGLVGKWHALKPKEFIHKTFDRIRNYYNKHWFMRDGKRRHVTDLNQQDAIDFLRSRPKNKRFALTVSFFATHAWEGADPPYQPMEESMRLYYVNQTIPRPKTATTRHWEQMPWFFNEKNMGRQRWMNRFDTDENYQNNIKNLYRMATEVDAAVGAIIDELKTQGVYDETLLIFTTDNGNLQGEHGLAEKWYPFEESIRVPLVIQDPRMPPNMQGTRNDEFTLSIDLAPTLLSAAHIPVPLFMQGRDIAHLYLNDNDNKNNNNDDAKEALESWRQDFFYEWNQGNPLDAAGHKAKSRNVPAVFALIRKDYKYFYWPETGYEQLFRIENDPYEECDLLNNTDVVAATTQTTKFALQLMRARYQFSKAWAQSGNPV